MNSCLYECSVMHHRLAPREHHFAHDIFMFYLDLDELDSVARKTFLFSRNRINFYTFRDDDHLLGRMVNSPGSNSDSEPQDLPMPGARRIAPRDPSPSKQQGGDGGESVPASRSDKESVPVRVPVHGEEPSSLKKKVLGYLARNGVPFPADGRIMLLTLPRVLGYVFNPVSFYFCFDAAGAPLCAVAEVGNTFREMKLFLLRAGELEGSDTFCQVTSKHFYVSPFSSLELSFDFKLRIPGEAMQIHIDDRDGPAKVLLSTLSGKRAALSNANLFWFSLKYPLVTLKIIFLIHWHALLLYLKRVPFFRKAANPARQCDVLNPHPTLTGRIK